MRFIRQPTSISCGPTAVLNVLKWAGIEANLSHFPLLEFSCQTVDFSDPNNFEKNGTTDHDFDRVLRYVTKAFLKVRRNKRPSFKKIIEHLYTGESIVLSYRWEEDGQFGDHFCFLAGMKNGLIVCVNDHNAHDKNPNLRRKTTIKQWLKKGLPYAWFLTRVKQDSDLPKTSA